MKKLTIFPTLALMATLFVFGMSSCSKHDDKPLVDQLKEQATYEVKHVTINDAEIMPALSYQVGSTNPAPYYAEIAINDGGAIPEQGRESHLYTDPSVQFNQQTITASRTNSGSAVTLVFKNTNSCYVAPGNQWNNLPIGLQRQNLLTYVSNGNGADGQYYIAPSLMSGTYTIEKTTTGFLLTMMQGSTVATIELVSKLKG